MNSTAPFDVSARVYDLLYGEKDYLAEAEYIAALLSHFHSNVRTVLDLGCGTGRHARRLIDLGIEVVGVERSAEMAARAREVEGLTVIDGDVRTVRVNRSFDAVLAMFHVVSYQKTIEDLIATFVTAEQHLTAAGLFVFDVWSTPAVLTQRPERRRREVADSHVKVIRTAHPVEDVQNSIVEVHYELEVTERSSGVVEKSHETHVMRHLTQGEVELLARSAGLAVVHAEEFLTRARPSDETWGVCYALKRMP